MLDAGGLYYGRHERSGPPTALFSYDLAMLEYNIDHLDQFTPNSSFLELARTFVYGAAKFFQDEGAREQSLHDNLEGLLGSTASWRMSIARRSTKPDAVWYEKSLAYLIAEIKNEQGLGGDPFLQSLVVYKKITGGKKVLTPPTCSILLH